MYAFELTSSCDLMAEQDLECEQVVGLLNLIMELSSFLILVIECAVLNLLVESNKFFPNSPKMAKATESLPKY